MIKLSDALIETQKELGLKICIRCKELRPETRFSLQESGRPRNVCKHCESARVLERYYINKAKKNASRD
jgi:hypothetical protein